MLLKINKDMRTPQGLKKKDDIIEIPGQNKVPAELFWRNRLKDSTIDNCVELVVSRTTKIKKSK